MTELESRLADEQAKRIEAERRLEAVEKRNADVSMLAYKWMVAHDCRAAGEPYLLPTPADLPNALAERDALALRLDRYAKLEAACRGWKPVQASLHYPNPDPPDDPITWALKELDRETSPNKAVQAGAEDRQVGVVERHGTK